MVNKTATNALIISLAISFFSCEKVKEMKIEYPHELNSKTFENYLEIKGVKPKESDIEIYNNGKQEVFAHQNDYLDDEFSASVYLEEGLNNIKIKNLTSTYDGVLLKEVAYVVQKELSEGEKINKIKNDSIVLAKINEVYELIRKGRVSLDFSEEDVFTLFNKYAKNYRHRYNGYNLYIWYKNKTYIFHKKMERNDFPNSITVRWNNVDCPYGKSYELTEHGVQRTDCTDHPLIQRSKQVYLQIF
jgi:hypothetical protein